MADEGQVIRGINWRQTFPFVNIFRSFRVAIHPSKLFLGLALLLTIYVGGRVLDWVWPIRARAIPGEVEAYQAMRTHPGKPAATLREWRDEQQKQIDASYAQNLLESDIDAPAKKGDEKSEADARKQAEDDAKARRKIDDVLWKVKVTLSQKLKSIDEDYKKAIKSADEDYNKNRAAPGADKLHADAIALAEDTRKQDIAANYAAARQKYDEVESVRGVGLFAAFFGYELHHVTGVVEAVVHGNWLAPDGVVEHIENFLTVGPVWLISNHQVFAIIFFLLFLIAWSLFGGAISRIAAVHVARDEKISVRQAMNFSVGKFLSFASAPVIPLLIVIVVGLVVAAGALLGNIPFVGPIVIGGFFFLALLAGFVMTLVLLGTGGGFNLMYPTIAVEGSDSFDAISRSFSYVYARPWRMLFYTAIAIAYGAATYMFIHMFIWLMLVLTHYFVDMGIFAKAADGQPLLSAMWPSPTSAGRLAYLLDTLPLSTGQLIGARLIQIWVMLLVSFLGAFAISLYFSANTIIYFLMRSEVDATEMDDVYLEQSDEDFGETAPISTPAGTIPPIVTTPSASDSSISSSSIPSTDLPLPGEAPPV